MIGALTQSAFEAGIIVYTEFPTNMLKNITFSAEEALIEKGRACARAERTTLNEKFRGWLKDYVREEARRQKALAQHLETMRKLRVKFVPGSF
jgi:hypothetical protein